jgi:hypothetical protein
MNRTSSENWRKSSLASQKEIPSAPRTERQNLSMRMEMRRFTRLTNAFSIENHEHMIAIYFMHYNFCRIHKTLRCTPAKWKLALRIMFGALRKL